MVSEGDGVRNPEHGRPADTEIDAESQGVPGARRLLATLLLALIAVGCADQEVSVVRPDEPAVSLSERENQAAQEAEAFAAVIDSLNDDNEILIALKDHDVPVVSPEFAGGDKAELASGQPGVAFPVVPESAPRRKAEGFARANTEAQDNVRQLLAAHDLETDGEGQAFPVFRVHLPDPKAIPILTALLTSPYVDYIEAVHLRPVSLPAGPIGDNGVDIKHEIHQVEEAWEFTRGEGVKIGVFDTGFAGYSIGQWHPDGEYFSSPDHGIRKLGFADEYGSCIPANCQPRDDHGHGTHMVGLVGANDNDIDSVGVAPFAEVFSMKMIVNCLVAGCSGGDYVIADWAWVDALDYAATNDFDIISMSIMTDDGSAIEDALYDSYHTHDILLMSSAGNTGVDPPHQDFQWLVERSYVIGVGGMNGDSTNNGLDLHEEVSALSGGSTTHATCSGSDFCDPNGVASSSGTSASTAIAAGIAGLVRSYFPGWSAPTVRDRLNSTANLRESVMLLNAYEAIVNNPPDPAISGPRSPYKQVNETWEAFVDDGKPPFTYEWKRDGQVVSTTDSYTGNTGCSDFELRLTVTDSENRTRDTGVVDIEPDGFPPGAPETCIQ